MARILSVSYLVKSMIVVAAMLGTTGAGLAQNKLTTTVDQPIVVDRKASAITNEKANLGTVKVVPVAGPPASNVLIYVPPPGQKDIEDSVQYTVDNQSPTVGISVKPAAPQLNDAQFYASSFKALFALFIIAVITESGLALLFNWRPYLNRFDGKAANPLVALLFSLLLVWLFDLDIATSLMNTYSGSKLPANLPGMVLTAMIIAGGSAGVNKVFQAFGLRTPASQQEAAPKPPPTQAWLSVALRRDKADGNVDVLIGPTGHQQAAGSIAGTGSRRSVLSWLLRNKSRYPQSGGHVMAPGTPIEVSLVGMDSNKQPIRSATWGPYELAAGAIVDVELTL
jgi:hypothetical protein